MLSLGALIIDIQSTTLDPEEKELISHPLVGGVILFTRNYESRKQLTALCQQIRALRSTPLLIMVDQEGGRVQRFKHEFTRLPPMGFFGKVYDKNVEEACTLALDSGWLMASELLTTGIDLSLAPVLDLNKGLNSVIGDRAFHRDKHIVANLALAFAKGMQEAGMAVTGKHFPGHGGVTLDSHTAQPIDERQLSTILQEDILPFTKLMQAGMSAVMAAHIVFPHVDHQPVSFSSIWLNNILRKQLGFHGIIFSDDLNMEGAAIYANYADRVMAARAAGCDFALLCNHRKAVVQVLDNVPANQHQIEYQKWHPLKGRSTQPAFSSNKRWQKIHQLLSEALSF